jgi:hypothetical protein
MTLKLITDNEVVNLPYGTYYVKVEVVWVGQSQGYPEHYSQEEVCFVSDKVLTEEDIKNLILTNFGPTATGVAADKP